MSDPPKKSPLEEDLESLLKKTQPKGSALELALQDHPMEFRTKYVGAGQEPEHPLDPSKPRRFFEWRARIRYKNKRLIVPSFVRDAKHAKRKPLVKLLDKKLLDEGTYDDHPDKVQVTPTAPTLVDVMFYLLANSGALEASFDDALGETDLTDKYANLSCTSGMLDEYV